ncbi:hypothetical protein KY334_01635 [Candidatus Woesearchaeota archaeon]|nr:hypothetical protein [Candidatus Woesearchaeota archaeon]
MSEPTKDETVEVPISRNLHRDVPYILHKITGQSKDMYRDGGSTVKPLSDAVIGVYSCDAKYYLSGFESIQNLSCIVRVYDPEKIKSSAYKIKKWQRIDNEKFCYNEVMPRIMQLSKLPNDDNVRFEGFPEKLCSFNDGSAEVIVQEKILGHNLFELFPSYFAYQDYSSDKRELYRKANDLEKKLSFYDSFHLSSLNEDEQKTLEVLKGFRRVERLGNDNYTLMGTFKEMHQNYIYNSRLEELRFSLMSGPDSGSAEEIRSQISAFEQKLNNMPKIPSMEKRNDIFHSVNEMIKKFHAIGQRYLAEYSDFAKRDGISFTQKNANEDFKQSCYRINPNASNDRDLFQEISSIFQYNLSNKLLSGDRTLSHGDMNGTNILVSYPSENFKTWFIDAGHFKVLDNHLLDHVRFMNFAERYCGLHPIKKEELWSGVLKPDGSDRNLRYVTEFYDDFDLFGTIHNRLKLIEDVRKDIKKGISNKHLGHFTAQHEDYMRYSLPLIADSLNQRLDNLVKELDVSSSSKENIKVFRDIILSNYLPKKLIREKQN